MTPRKPRKWNLPLTYAPKIEAVRNGTCTQTIRVTGKTPKKVGDLVSFHGYQNGRGTPWTWRTPYKTITYIKDITIVGRGIICGFAPEELPSEQREEGSFLTYKLWLWNELHWLAALDGIVPPTGEALRDVLVGMNGKIPEDGIEAQVIRWKV